jgi:hypothetical protein
MTAVRLVVLKMDCDLSNGFQLLPRACPTYTYLPTPRLAYREGESVVIGVSAGPANVILRTRSPS